MAEKPKVLRLRALKTSTAFSLYAFFLLSFCASAFGQEPFYKAKTIRIIVGFAAGGGFDTYARLLAPYLSKHIPGNPTVVVDNMPGAGALISANYLYKMAKPDGLTIGHFVGTLFLGQVLGQKGIEFDARNFEFIGAPAKEHGVCAFSKASGVTSMEKWQASKAPVKMGGLAPGSGPDTYTRILRTALGLPIQVVTGYKGTSDIRLAVESGELAGGCLGWDSISATWRRSLDAGDVVVVLQAARKPHPDFPKVPNAIDLAKTTEGRQLIEVVIHGDSEILRTYTLPPGTPKERLQTLRKAFVAILKDKEFLADAEKAKVGVDLVTGEDLEKIIAALFNLDPALVAKLKDVLYK